jgi:hypothetical protein
VQGGSWSRNCAGASDSSRVGGGATDEHETIKVVEMPLCDLVNLADRSELTDLKTFTLALRVRRPDLFAAAEF